jgi:hypothetical protein
MIPSVEQEVNTQITRKKRKKKTLNKSDLKSAKCTSLVESVIAPYEYSISKLIRRRLQRILNLIDESESCCGIPLSL